MFAFNLSMASIAGIDGVYWTVGGGDGIMVARLAVYPVEGERHGVQASPPPSPFLSFDT